MSDIIIIQGQIRFNPPITNQKVTDLKREHNFKYIDITNNYVTCLVPYNWIPAKGFRDELEIFANNMKGKLFRERFSGEILAYKGSPNAKSAWRYFIKYGKVQSDNNAAFKFIKYYKPKPKRHAKWVKPEHDDALPPPQEEPSQNKTIFQKKSSSSAKPILKKLASSSSSSQTSTLSSSGTSRAPSPPPPPQTSPQSSKQTSRHTSRPPTPPMDLDQFIDYNAITDNNSQLESKEVYPYLKLLVEKGKKVKRIGHVALLPPDWFYYLYENPKQEAVDSLFEYLSKAPQFNKKPIDYYDCIVIPAELEEHWILIVIDNGNKDIGVYDSNMKAYPDIGKIINKFLKSQGINQKYPMRYNRVPKQNNDIDCAILMMQNARILLHDGKWPYPIDDVPNIRQRIARELKSKSLETAALPPTPPSFQKHSNNTEKPTLPKKKMSQAEKERIEQETYNYFIKKGAYHLAKSYKYPYWNVHEDVESGVPKDKSKRM